MPNVTPQQEKQQLDFYIQRLVGAFGREQSFTIEDLYTAGGTERGWVGDKVILPPEHAEEHLTVLKNKGLIAISADANRRFIFKVTDSYRGLPDRITPQDIFEGKMSILENELEVFAPKAYAKLVNAEKRLITLTNEDQQYSEIGNLCIQCLEDFGEVFWDRGLVSGSKPAKKQLKDLLSPVFKKYIPSRSGVQLADSMWELFDDTRDLIEKLKHRTDKGSMNAHNARLAVLLTAMICEEILFHRNEHTKT